MALEIIVPKYKYFRILKYDQIILPLMLIQYVIHVSEELQTWIKTDFLRNLKLLLGLTPNKTLKVESAI